MSTQIVPVEGLQAGLTELRQKAESIVVSDSGSCLAAKTAQRDVRAYMKDVHLKLDPFVESAKRNYQAARDELNKWIEPAETIDGALARKVKDYETQERMRAEAEERRINEERRKKAADDAEAERKRREKEIEAQRKAGEVGKREAERMKKEAEAEAKAQAAAVVDVKVQANIPSVQGVPSRVNWKFRIVDANKIPKAYLIPDEQKIGQTVRLLKDKARTEAVIPGIEVYTD